MADDYFKRNHWNKKDEYYTPTILVDCIIPHLHQKNFKTIWCPFDTEKSEFVIRLREEGFDVIHSHIWEGKDFFHFYPEEHFDAIISNPPFTMKLKVLEKLYSIGKPFAVIMGLPILNYQEVGEFFHAQQSKGNFLELLIVDKKVSFDGNTASFNNSYFCSGILQSNIMFAHVEHNNTKRKHVPSRMYDDLPDEFKLPQTKLFQAWGTEEE